jgi:hypothetical protein
MFLASGHAVKLAFESCTKVYRSASVIEPAQSVQISQPSKMLELAWIWKECLPTQCP